MERFVFIDRDGVVNKDPVDFGKYYVTSWEDFHFLPGALEAIKKLADNNYKIAVISNQAGVAKGVYTKTALDEITARMLERIKEAGGSIYSVQYCVHKAEDNCDCRKPKAGAFKKAAQGVKVDFAKSYFVGDTQRDMQAGRAVGLTTILVLSGRVKTEGETRDWPVKPDLVKKDLAEAAQWLISNDKDREG